MYVLTNKERSLGAGTFLYPGVLKQAEELLGERFYVLPSSIHECILIPEEEGMYQEALTEIVTEINESQVDRRRFCRIRRIFTVRKIKEFICESSR